MTDAPRACADCQADISSRHGLAKLCIECYKERDNERQKRRRKDPDIRAQMIAWSKRNYHAKWKGAREDERARQWALRTCADCGTSIADRRPPAELCVPCGNERIRLRLHTRGHDPEERAKQNARRRIRLATDGEYRRRTQERNRERHKRVGGLKPRRWLPDAIARQNGICTWCDLPLPDDLSEIHADHIYPVSRGGETSPENTAALHAFCNMAKGDRLVA